MKKLIRIVLLSTVFVLLLSACGTDQPPADYGEAEPLVEEAVQDLSGRLGIAEDEIDVVTVEETEFPDASLGVPEQGQMYAQVIAPGYIFVFEAGGEEYTYHAAGERVVLVQ